MSALPPYQRTGTSASPELVMVLAADLEAHAAVLQPELTEVRICVVDGEVPGLDQILPEGVSQVMPGVDLDLQVRGLLAGGDVLLVAPEPVLQEVFAAFMRTPPEAATVRFLPGCTTRLQPLPDRVVLRHLNLGGV